MTLAESLLRQLDDPTLSPDERARLRCQAAADLEHRGQYETAREALADLWQGVGRRPVLEGLNALTAAEVLLRAGTLSAWLGSAHQLEGALDAAKDLISESISRFQALGETSKAADAQGELGFCYRRAGAYEEARITYHEALKGLAGGTDEGLRAKLLLRLAALESFSGKYKDSLDILTGSAELFAGSTSDALKGKFHNELACALTLLAQAERQPDYTDRAIIEYTAASHYFELAGHTKYRARAENNLGFLLYQVGRYTDAHEHLNHARRLFVSEGDEGSVAQVDETRARVFLAEGRTREAERAIRESVRTLEMGGEQPSLSEALTTQGHVLARIGDFVESENVMRRAADLAEQAGAVEDAGRALLSLIEEHTGRVAERDLFEAYQRANDLLKETQDGETVARLRDCAARIVSVYLSPAQVPWEHGRADFWANFSLPERVRAYEAHYIQRALIDAHGSITQAARLLGLGHPTKLASILRTRHKDLAHLRTPPETRRRSIIRDDSSRQRPRAQAARILLLEGDDVTAAAVRDTLEGAGHAVVACAGGAQAMRILGGNEPFDLVIFDSGPPGPAGIELIRYARSLPHRRRVPFVMLAAHDAEGEAWSAGADAFLRKPEEVSGLAAAVSRLLAKNTG